MFLGPRERHTEGRTRRDQRGMTLVESMLAVFLSGLMVLPMLGWATMAMKEQANVEQRDVTASSLGLLRTYFVRDVTNATAATVQDAALLSCGSDVAVDRALLGVLRASTVVTYAVVTDDDGTKDLWRLECPKGSTTTVDRVELLGEVNDAGTSARCDSLDTLAEADESAGTTSTRGRGSGKVDPTKDKDGNPDDNDNGKGNDGKDKGGGTPSIDSDACRRVTLQVTTVDLRQVALTATVRSGATAGAEDISPPSAVVSASPTSGVRRLTVQFVGSGSTDPGGLAMTYAWDFGDGTTSAEANPTKSYVNVGVVTATLTVTNSAGLSSSASISVTVADNAPTAVISSPGADTTVYRGQEVSFSSAGSNDDLDKEFGGTIASYAWDFGDGTTSTEANPKKAYSTLSPAGGYVVSLAVTDDAGQVAASQTTLTVANRLPTVVILADPTSGAVPLTVDFASVVTDETTMAVNPALTYAWDFGDGDTSALADPPARTYSTTGTKTVTVSVTDDVGAVATASVDIQVDAAVLSPPTGLTKKNSGSSGGKRYLDLQFDAVAGAAEYEVQVSCTSKNCSDSGSATGTATTLRISGLQNKSTNYDAQVRVRNSTGQWSDWSAAAKVKT